MDDTRDTTQQLAEATVVLTEKQSSNCSSGKCVYDPPPEKSQSRYRFVRSIGFGGMKSVLLVHDSDTNREVAMALMPDFRDRPESDLQRFVREAKLTASLEHPYIVPVHDIGTDKSGSPYFTMKYLRGLPLSTLISRLSQQDPQTIAEYPPARLLRLFVRICQAVEFAHANGYCHLDLKPGNINVGEFGDTYVLDWGLARAVDSTGYVIAEPCAIAAAGTPGYMAPEQITPEAGSLGVKSDIYALGALLYTILTLKSPGADTPKEEIFRRTLTGEIPVPSAVAPSDVEIPDSLEAVVLHAMAPDPENRYNSVKELRTDILAYTSGFATTAEHASPVKRLMLFITRNAIIILAAMLGIALAITLILLWMN